MGDTIPFDLIDWFSVIDLSWEYLDLLSIYFRLVSTLLPADHSEIGFKPYSWFIIFYFIILN